MSADRTVRLPAVLGLGVGVVAGLASGLLGIGGGLVVVPVLAAWLSVPIKRAVGTSLLAVLVTASVGVCVECVVAPANLRWAVALVLAAAAIAGSWIGTRLISRLHPARLAKLMAAVLVLAAVRMSGLLAFLAPSRETAAPLGEGALAAAHAITGVAAGIVGALFGIGGGILAVPALSILHPDWPFQACRATSLVMIVPTSLAAALMHRRLANVDGAIARTLVPGSVLGSVVGVVLANRVAARPLELLFALLLVVSAIQIARRKE